MSNNPPGAESTPAVCPCDCATAVEVMSQKQNHGASIYTLLTSEVTLMFGVYHASKYASVNVETSGRNASKT